MKQEVFTARVYLCYFNLCSLDTNVAGNSTDSISIKLITCSVCVCMCVRAHVCVCVFMCGLWTSGSAFQTCQKLQMFLLFVSLSSLCFHHVFMHSLHIKLKYRERKKKKFWCLAQVEMLVYWEKQKLNLNKSWNTRSGTSVHNLVCNPLSHRPMVATKPVTNVMP